MRWDNDAGLQDLLAEAARLDDGYVTVARVLPGRREEQLASMQLAPASRLAQGVEVATRHLPAEARVRVRTWRRGGKPVSGVVVRRLTAPGTSPAPAAEAPSPVQDDDAQPEPAPSQPEPALPPETCPSCAELREALDDQHGRFDEVCDERDDANAHARRLERDLAALQANLDSAVLRAETAERERDNVRRLFAQAESRFDRQHNRILGLERDVKRLRELARQGKQLAAMVNALEIR